MNDCAVKCPYPTPGLLGAKANALVLRQMTFLIVHTSFSLYPVNLQALLGLLEQFASFLGQITKDVQTKYGNFSTQLIIFILGICLLLLPAQPCWEETK